MRWLTGLLIWALAAGGAFAGNGANVSGSANYRERMALPPGAVFEAILEDVSLADAPAIELGRATIADPGAPPFEFTIDYDPALIRPERTYSVRAQVSVGRKLLFVSDTMNPVLTRGESDQASIWMIKVGDTTPPAPDKSPTIGAHGLRLPATFVGEMPCADCAAETFHLNLWPDQVFFLRRTADGKRRQDAVGRWSVNPDTHILDLRGAGAQYQFQILGTDRLRLKMPDEKRPASDDDYDLIAADELSPFDPHLPLRGMLTYVSDEARFTECLTGRDYPLVKDGDYAALEHAYLAAGAEVEGPIMASFDGAIIREPDGDDVGDVGPKVLVERFVGVWPGETCERAVDKASLTNTYWKILRLGDTEVAPGEGRREPNLILRAGESRFTATVGCNQVNGSYTLESDRLGFGEVTMTRSACPTPLDEWESKLVGALGTAATWRIDGQTLELLDDAGNAVALFQAVYLY
jgi:copper homeostasis protein (lipoprotein)